MNDAGEAGRALAASARPALAASGISCRCPRGGLTGFRRPGRLWADARAQPGERRLAGEDLREERKQRGFALVPLESSGDLGDRADAGIWLHSGFDADEVAAMHVGGVGQSTWVSSARRRTRRIAEPSARAS